MGRFLFMLKNLFLMNIAIVSWAKDKSGMNIKENLINNFDFKELEETFDDNKICQYEINDEKIIKLYTINSEHIFTDDLDKKIQADVFVFISKHSAAEGRPSLTCHPIGNFGKAEKGGKEKTLCISHSILLKNIFIELNNNVKEPYEATMEATHHGPCLEKPVLFVEIGSTEKEWMDKNAGSIIAKSVIKAIKEYNDSDSMINNYNEKNSNIAINKDNENNINNKSKINEKNNNELMNENQNYESVFIIGGSHYNHVANKTMLKTKFAAGHVCAKYNLENLDGELIKKSMIKTIPESKFVLLDWKGLGKEKARILEILEKNNIEFQRSDKFFEK